jgi:hypothetical protein
MVDTQSGSDGTRDGMGAGDPFVAFATALRDMCILGSFAVENTLAQGDVGGVAEQLAPFLDPMLRAASAFRELTESGVNALGGEGPASPDGAPRAAGVASLVAQAYLAAAVSGFRYWRRVAQTYGAHQSSILQSFLAGGAGSSVPDEERRALIEEVRAYLREVGDVSLQEARILQSELEKLSAGVAEAGGAGAEPSKHRRRWRAKP